jgi:uncharacterized membrane protein
VSEQHPPREHTRRAVEAGEAVDREIARLDPYWAPQLVVGCAIALGLALPGKLTLGPYWLVPAIEGVLLLALFIATPHPRVRHSPLRRRFAIGMIGLVSAVNIFSLVELVRYLLSAHGSKASGRALIFAGVALWLTNVLLFSLWYWELDRGGPAARAQDEGAQPDFMFPQMVNTNLAPPGWRPGLIDYLYLAFTNATAFSPTDVMPLTQVAKLLMTAQALTSLLVVALVVGRAVNILA